ncbi:MAG: SDR family oxidoreductase [Cyanobacteria bacterium J06623_4]
MNGESTKSANNGPVALSSRRALITGASSGIGKATARAFAQAGFDVALVARSEALLSELATELTTLGIVARAFVIDLSKIETVKEKVSQAIAAFGPVDVLVNNAGMGYTGTLIDMPLDDWQQVMALNVTSVLQVVQAVLPQMRNANQRDLSRQSGGLIVNIASIAAQQSFPEWGAYGVSKAALTALSGAIAAEESANGIRVATLSPGAVDTPIWESSTVHSSFDRAAMLRAETVAQTILHMAMLPPDAVISQLTLTPAQGAL